jgi:hypothetical protein
VGSNGECDEAPARCVLVVATAKQPARGSYFGGLTLSGGVWCCSGTMVEDHA